MIMALFRLCTIDLMKINILLQISIRYFKKQLEIKEDQNVEFIIPKIKGTNHSQIKTKKNFTYYR